MAKAAVETSLPNENLPFERRQAIMGTKRKTPSELREEQLKRRNGRLLGSENSVPSLDLNKKNGGISNGSKESEPFKIPRYTDTRVDAVYQVRKSSERCKIFYGNSKLKDIGGVPNGSARLPDDSDRTSPSCDKETFQSPGPSARHGFQKIERCSQSVLRNVAEIHLGCEKPDSAEVDMEKALKGLGAQELVKTKSALADTFGKSSNLQTMPSPNICSQFQILGHKGPLDLTLKTNLRLVSSSSVKWCHALVSKPANVGLSECISHFSNENQNQGCFSSAISRAEALFSKALISWVYPQSSLPPSVISALCLPTVRGELDFLSKRRQDWEDSFRNLYFMLRKNLCNIFYVCTSQFVVLFIGGNVLGKKRMCNAYISQSTQGLRSLLRKHDVKFSMPLCRAEMEQASEEELVELSEIEKRNIGQTVYLDPFSDLNNTHESLLSFIGYVNVHGLYDFLLNYRFFLNSMTRDDVPTLHSPLPFQNASLITPEVRCKEMKTADSFLLTPCGSDSDDRDANLDSSKRGLCYSIEIKDTILPPWVVSRVCAAMSSEGRSFDVSFTTEPKSEGLNVALDSVYKKCDSDAEATATSPESGDVFGIPEAVLTPRLRSASLRRLKYYDGFHFSGVNLAVFGVVLLFGILRLMMASNFGK